MDTKQWSAKKLAQRANLTTARIRQLLIAGKELTGYKLGRDWFVDDDEVQRWLKTRSS